LNTTDVTKNDTNQNLTAYNVSTADADNDAVKNIYNWYMNGTSITVLNMPFEGINGTDSNNSWDYSGYGNNGKDRGKGIFWNATGGYDGRGAYKFNGSIMWINYPTNTLTNPTELTVTGWFKQEDSTKELRPFSHNANEPYISYRFNQGGTANRLQINFKTSVSEHTLINTSYTLSEWHYITVTSVENDYIKLYVDGVLASNVTGIGDYETTAQTDTNGNNIGADRDGATNFNGTIDEVLIYNRSLSPEQILALYNNRTDLIVSQETNKGEYWNVSITPNDGFDDGITLYSNTVQIIAIPNNLPTQGTPILNTTNLATNATNTNLTAYNVSTADIDDEIVKNIYNWYVNGASLTVLNMPFEGINNTATNNAYDYSGYGNNGSERGGVLWNATGGVRWKRSI